MIYVIVGLVAAVMGFIVGLVVALVSLNNLLADVSDEDNYAEFYDPVDYR